MGATEAARRQGDWRGAPFISCYVILRTVDYKQRGSCSSPQGSMAALSCSLASRPRIASRGAVLRIGQYSGHAQACERDLHQSNERGERTGEAATGKRGCAMIY